MLCTYNLFFIFLNINSFLFVYYIMYYDDDDINFYLDIKKENIKLSRYNNKLYIIFKKSVSVYV
jgi:hypothetical protein